MSLLHNLGYCNYFLFKPTISFFEDKKKRATNIFINVFYPLFCTANYMTFFYVRFLCQAFYTSFFPLDKYSKQLINLYQISFFYSRI